MEQLAITGGKLDYADEIGHRGSVWIGRHKSYGKQFRKQYVIAVARHLSHSRLDPRLKIVEAAPCNRKLTRRNFCRTHRAPPGPRFSTYRLQPSWRIR